MEKLQRRDSYLASARICVFISTLVGAALLASRDPAGFGHAPQLLTFAGVVVFVILIGIHHRVDSGIQASLAHLRLLSEEEARRTLDWRGLPEVPMFEVGSGISSSPRYFSDLDLFGSHSFLRLIQTCISDLGQVKLVDTFRSNGISAEEIVLRQRLVRESHRARILRLKCLRAARSGPGNGSEKTLNLTSLRQWLNSPGSDPIATRWVAAVAVIQVAGWALFGWGVFLSKGLAPYSLAAFGIAFLVFKIGEKHFEGAFDRALGLQLSLSSFMKVARVLETARFRPGSSLSELLSEYRSSERPSRMLKRIDSLVGWMSFRANPLVYVAVNAVFPWDGVLAILFEKQRRALVARFEGWTEALARFEVCMSLGAFADAEPRARYPRLVPASVAGFRGAGLEHPLIPKSKRVGNPVRLGKPTSCLLITGSNMSGKSTYLRTLGVNLLLAKAGAPVLADDLEFTNLDLHTSLRVSDSIEDEVSSFYAEVKQLKLVLDAASQAQKEGRPGVLYLVDEIFRGTNAKERGLGSRAYLEAIIQTPALGDVATHDLELTELSGDHPEIVNAHFRESIEGDRMVFHHRMEPGPCPSTNALVIMKLAGLPVPPVLDEGLSSK